MNCPLRGVVRVTLPTERSKVKHAKMPKWFFGIYCAAYDVICFKYR